MITAGIISIIGTLIGFAVGFILGGFISRLF